MRILGIDPGLGLTGYACLESLASTAPIVTGDRVSIVEAGVFRLGRAGLGSTPGGMLPALGKRAGGTARATSVSSRLEELDHDFRALIARTSPQAIAIESLFAHYKHPATAIIMGHARGVLLLAVQHAGVQLFEFKPNLVKKSLTGNGLAKKEQMQRAVRDCFGLAQVPDPPDVADAIAIALCAFRRTQGAAQFVEQI
jgi:crossover junction endodeoxyribonuclease RuvC